MCLFTVKGFTPIQQKSTRRLQIKFIAGLFTQNFLRPPYLNIDPIQGQGTLPLLTVCLLLLFYIMVLLIFRNQDWGNNLFIRKNYNNVDMAYFTSIQHWLNEVGVCVVRMINTVSG